MMTEIFNMAKSYINTGVKPKKIRYTSLSDKLWQLDKKLIEGHHYIKLSDALQLVSRKKLDQKL